jgi:hypothetical protein
MFHLKNDLPDQRAIITDAAIDEMHRPSPETGPMREWEREGSGYGVGWNISVTEDGSRAVHHAGGTVGVSTVLALVPEESLAVVVLSNTESTWPETILIEILQALLPNRFDISASPAGDQARVDSNTMLPQELIGWWEGLAYTYEGELPLVLVIEEAGDILARLGEGSFDPLRDVSYKDHDPKFPNSGGGPFLRGWMLGDLRTADVSRGRPYKLWIELKFRNNVLNGSLIAFSQRENSTGPLAHWVELSIDKNISRRARNDQD